MKVNPPEEDLMFKRIHVRIFVLLSLLAIVAAAIIQIGGSGAIGQRAFWGSLGPQPAEAAGAIVYVDASAGGAGTGLNWTDAKTNLQDGMEMALSGDQVWVAAGVYYPDEGSAPTEDDPMTTFTLKNGVAVYGGFAGGETTLSERNWETNVTVLSGDIDQDDTTDSNGVVTDVGDIAGTNAYHVVKGGGTNSSAILDGFTITAGRANGLNQTNGAGLENLNSSPTLTNLTFSGNWADGDGGGIRNFQSSPTLTKVDFLNNKAVSGGGMYNYASSSPTLTEVSFTGNMVSNDGGGMSNGSNSSPTLTNVSFTGNQALGGGSIGAGGGMYSDGGNPTLTNVIFSGNQAAGGGGMYNDSIPSLTNVIFSGNLAEYGGGMYNDNSLSLELINVSFSGNRASTFGGGMFNMNTGGIFYQLIMWNNSGGSIYNITSSPTIAYSVIEGCGGSGFMTWNTAMGTDGGDNFDVDPLFVTPIDPATAPTTAGNLRLQVGSPAVDTGGTFCPPTDLDGFSRPIDGDLDGSAVCDMGAYEKTIDLFLPLIMR
jgi:hypothetical protein